MKTKNVSLVLIVLGVMLVGCQPKSQPVGGNIYTICDPQIGRSSPIVDETITSLGDILNDEIADIYIDQLNDGWLNKKQAEDDLLAIFGESDIEASTGPLWNMAMPVDLVATITYQDGTQRVAAVAGWRVCFQDKAGKPWYFQWDARLPDDW
jgi:hypothetical protein